MTANLANEPIATLRAHTNQFIWWNGEDGSGWGKLLKAQGKTLHVELDCGVCKLKTTVAFAGLTFLGVATPRTITPTWTHLREGTIIGRIDEHDAVESHFVPADRRAYIAHDHFWPGKTHGLWRWFFDQGLTAFVAERAWLPGQADFIQTHITKRYGIQWYENGYHDLNHLCAHVAAQEAADEAKS